MKRKEAILEAIGAVAVTTVILGVPILSLVSFLNDWPAFLEFNFIVGTAVDFLYVLDMLLGEIE